ncbi:MAG: glycosyltransferase, partial [Clostridia bacterium]
MRVLILSITAGQGHHAAGKSVSDALVAQGATVQTIDVYKEINRLLYDGVNRGYLFSTKYAPAAYRHFYTLFENRDKSGKYSITTLVNMLLGNKFEHFIEDFAPNAIVCTHIFSAQVINELKRQSRYLDVPTLGIVTDYTLHPFWQDVPYIEYIDLASELLYNKAIRRGIERERLCAFGIPVQEKFSEKIPKAEARERLGLPTDARVALLMAGSMGYGNMAAIADEICSLDMNIQILAVCGRNTRQQKKLLELMPRDNLHIFGFIDNVDVMMDAADCIITKPGGLTVTEAMAKKLPMILINPIPGQEERNVDFLLNNGIALSVNKSFTVDDAMYYLFECPGRLESIEERLNAIA